MVAGPRRGGLSRVLAYPFLSGDPGRAPLRSPPPASRGRRGERGREAVGHKVAAATPLPESGPKPPLAHAPAARFLDTAEAGSGTWRPGESLVPRRHRPRPRLPGSAGAEGAGPGSASGGGGRGLGRQPERRGRAWRRRRRRGRRGREM